MELDGDRRDGDWWRLRAALGRLAEEDLAMAVSVIEDLASASQHLSLVRAEPKVTLFGSARIARDSPAWRQAFELARSLSRAGYTIVTGGGPGVMTAGLEGADVGRALGVSINLPFETANAGEFPVVLQDRFFTRKLAMVRHVRGFIAAAGGFGTADEVLEVLVLLQTGKKRPAPVVLLDAPGEPHWGRFEEWVREQLVPAGLISPADLSLFRVCGDVEDAHDEITGFYSRYRALTERVLDDGRFGMLLARLPEPEELAALDERFGDICPTGGFGIAPSEEGQCLAFHFDRRQWGRLRQLIDALNAADL